MKRIHFNLFFTLLIVVVAISIPFLLGNTPLPSAQPSEERLNYNVASPTVPKNTQFAGEKIDLTRYDMRERMDRELTTFTFMHSTTMLMIKRANRFFPMVEPMLKANGIPDDFKYLMVIESNLNTLARSPSGAVGLWQFMEATAREHGLEVNKNVDERLHIQKATVAACRYLKNAYAKYGDWMSVAASYNAGQNRISTALNQQQVSTATDLWLNNETSRYLFRILAAKEVFGNPRAYGFLLKKENLYPVIPHKEVKISTEIPDLVAFAKSYGITYAQLKDANSWLRQSSLENKKGKVYTLNIPTKEGMNYNPAKTVPHHKNWVVD